VNNGFFFRLGVFFQQRVRLYYVVGMLLLVQGLSLLPVAQTSGYELAALFSVAMALGGLPVGVAMARIERRQPRPRAVLAFALSMLILVFMLLPALVFSLLRAALTTPCSPWFGIHYQGLLVWPSLLLVAGLGLAIGSFTTRWWTAALLGAAVIVISAAHTLWPIVFGPQVFAYNHLAGFLPGPLYDEALTVPRGLYWFRLATLCAAAAAFLLFRYHMSKRGLLLLMLSAAAFGVIEWSGVDCGFRMDDATLSQRLGGSATIQHLTVHYPAELSAAQRRQLVEDVAFRHAQVARFLGEMPQDDVTVWVYRSAAEKQRLVGAAATQFAKPWRHEIHINASPFPHGVLKHELVHAMAASWSRQLFRVPTQWLLPQVALIEGLAVAADNPVDDLTLSEWAAAMKKKGLLPAVERLMQPHGFYGEAPSRAYVTAGAFLQFLQQRFGSQRLKTLYQSGDFQTAYTMTLSVLQREFETFLETVALDERKVNQAFARFSHGSLFDRTCAREVAGLAETLDDLPPNQALDGWRRVSAMQPKEPAHLWTVASLLERLGQIDAAKATLNETLVLTQEAPQSKAQTLMRLVTLEASDDEKRGILGHIDALKPSVSLARTALVRRAQLELPADAREAVESYFEGPPVAAVVRLSAALMQHPGEPTLSYLLGRVLTLNGMHAEALTALGDALQSSDEAMRVETIRLLTEAAFLSDKCGQVRLWVERAQRESPALSLRLRDYVERCDFKENSKL
jgi:hypothetical protein